MSILKIFFVRGIYLHIPFCKQLCSYCDFYFSVSQANKEAMLQALMRETVLRRRYLAAFSGEPATLYFGGGTPTVYSPQELGLLVETVRSTFDVRDFVEFTVEANPDDLTPEYLNGLLSIGVNRLSIGIQSFNDTHLQWMNRRHNAAQAVESVRMAKQAGFRNITIDLIYGFPQLSDNEWKTTLEQALLLDVPHISAYHLTIEPRTILGRQQAKGSLDPINEEESEAQFLQLHTTLLRAYEHYEVSNFAREGMQAIHNSNYWQQQPYIGIGPSAHSFDMESRQWNVANNLQYMEALDNGTTFFEQETLDAAMRYNEYILTRLRTAKGVDENYIRKNFEKKIAAYFLKKVKPLLQKGAIVKHDSIFFIPAKLFLQSDLIVRMLIY